MTFIFAIFSGILVLINKNPVISILFLISLFLSIASYLILAGINFIGISYLVVYIGAISILFLFILMLINIRISELLSNTKNSIPLGILVSILYYYPIYPSIPDSFESQFELTDLVINNYWYNSYMIEFAEKKMSYVTSNVWDTSIMEYSHITSIGNIMYTSHSIWLILTSMVLLLSMVGSILLTVKKKD